MGREISMKDALEIAKQNEAEGLVFQPSNTRKAEFVCSCCGCCCGMLGIQKMLPKPVDFWATNFKAVINAEDCTGCETCIERCQVDALSMDEGSGTMLVDLNRCIGCGNCVPTCPTEAIKLEKREQEVAPPEKLEDLYDVIMANKKNGVSKIRLAAKIFLGK